ncbi:uncharacterized protein BJ171DRAFT_293984 [Polychytrium aggregatum]|uniref:uncharacterized protein n=1 Tax=Polychytrium aggregatum TaxID=110093 RepID=UPI0022FE50DF|nr:uncharacterized protein BJ171DRAFT_293984 [Polychytrium aggregatum]KAI9207254.1 hypothetical protein BJ171DRAFT_293984 [Polychytrium aggregatum]
MASCACVDVSGSALRHHWPCLDASEPPRHRTDTTGVKTIEEVSAAEPQAYVVFNRALPGESTLMRVPFALQPGPIDLWTQGNLVFYLKSLESCIADGLADAAELQTLKRSLLDSFILNRSSQEIEHDLHEAREMGLITEGECQEFIERRQQIDALCQSGIDLQPVDTVVGSTCAIDSTALFANLTLDSSSLSENAPSGIKNDLSSLFGDQAFFDSALGENFEYFDDAALEEFDRMMSSDVLASPVSLISDCSSPTAQPFSSQDLLSDLFNAAIALPSPIGSPSMWTDATTSAEAPVSQTPGLQTDSANSAVSKAILSIESSPADPGMRFPSASASGTDGATGVGAGSGAGMPPQTLVKNPNFLKVPNKNVKLGAIPTKYLLQQQILLMEEYSLKEIETQNHTDSGRPSRNRGFGASARPYNHDQKYEISEDRKRWRCLWCLLSGAYTPARRKGPLGSKTLCNACGMWFARRGYLPPERFHENSAASKKQDKRPLVTLEKDLAQILSTISPVSVATKAGTSTTASTAAVIKPAAVKPAAATIPKRPLPQLTDSAMKRHKLDHTPTAPAAPAARLSKSLAKAGTSMPKHASSASAKSDLLNLGVVPALFPSSSSLNVTALLSQLCGSSPAASLAALILLSRTTFPPPPPGMGLYALGSNGKYVDAFAIAEQAAALLGLKPLATSQTASEATTQIPSLPELQAALQTTLEAAVEAASKTIATATSPTVATAAAKERPKPALTPTPTLTSASGDKPASEPPSE